MRNAIILHGTCSKKDYYSDQYPSLSNRNWIPWLQKQLIVKDIVVEAPDILHAFKPDYRKWCRQVEQYDINSRTMLVGHSTGGGFWLRWLSEHPDLRVGKVVLVAPWLDPNNIKKTTFFNFRIDPTLARRTKGLTIFNSDNDHLGIRMSVETLLQTLKGYKYKEFHKYGHFFYEDMHSFEFPELLDEVLTEESV